MQRRRRVPSPSPKITGGGSGGGGGGGGGAEESASLKHTRRARFSGEKKYSIFTSHEARQEASPPPKNHHDNALLPRAVTLALSHISRPKTLSPNANQNTVHEEATATQTVNPKRILETYSSTTLSLLTTTPMASSSREDDDEEEK